MQKPIIIITVTAIIIIAFFVWKKDKVIAPASLPETPASNASTTDAPTPIVNEPAPKTYSYTNSEFDFAVKLPGLVATQKVEIPLSMYAIFTFGVGDQSDVEEMKRIPNTMAVYIWSNESDFNKMTDTGTALADETVNGTTFKVYSFTLEDTTSYHYTVKKDNLIYDVGVRKKSDISKFYLI